MLEQPILQSRTPRWLIPFPVLLGGGFIAGGAYFINLSLNQSEYIELITLSVGFVLYLIGICFIACLFWGENLDLYSDRLVVKTLLGYPKRIIPLENIRSWTEVERETQYLQWYDLTLYTISDTKFAISSLFNQNYQGLKSILTDGKPEDLNEIKKSKRKYFIRLSYALISLTFLMGVISFYLIKTRGKSFVTQDLIRLSVTVSHLKITSKSKWIEIQVKEYPKFKFHVNETGFHAVNLEKLRLKTGAKTQFWIDIDRIEYAKKISQKKALSFFDKTISYSSIKIFQFGNKTDEFLTLSQYLKERYKSYTLGIWVCSLLALLFASGSLYFYNKN